MITIEHILEISDSSMIWAPAVAGMYEPAKNLARSGHSLEAAKLAKQIRLANYGEEASQDILFRVRTTITIVTEPI